MSRFNPHHDLQPLFDATSKWKDQCIKSGGSLFSDANVWNIENIHELVEFFVNSPNEGSLDFIEKLNNQLAATRAGTKKLAAEILYVLFLCPSNTYAARKREVVRTVWNWSGEFLDEVHPLLSDAVLDGVGSGGTGFNTNRWREFRFAILFLEELFKLDQQTRSEMLEDGWKFAEWLEKISECDSRQFRHMLLFLLFPDQFERIFGGTDRTEIVSAFSGESKKQIAKYSALEIDKKLFEIREQASEKYGTKDLDFYSPPLKQVWRSETPNEPVLVRETEKQKSSDAPIMHNYPINLILFGPPGTGKTRELNSRTEKYILSAKPISREQWLAEKLINDPWFDVVFMALHLLGGKAKVNDITNHEFVVQKAKALGRTANIKQQIWASLQMHTPESSTTVNYAKRYAPFVFDKSENSVWNLIGNWQDECEEQIQRAEFLKSGKDTTQSIQRYEFVTFHQAYSYEDFVEGIRPVQDPETREPTYRVMPGVFKRICEKARLDPQNRYAIFIDEINRGNIAKIFGELITLIEIDKRGHFDISGEQIEGMSLTLPYSGDKFSVPSNLDIYGTMNTADRSIALLDTALRRRFHFQELMPNSAAIDGSNDGYIEDGEGGVINLRALLDTMNRRVRFLLSRDLMLGHAYFCKIRDFSDLKEVLLNQIIPLLQEYFYNDWHKIQLVFRDIGDGDKAIHPQIVIHEVISEVDVLGFDHDDYDDLIDYRIAKHDEITPESIRKVYESAK